MLEITAVTKCLLSKMFYFNKEPMKSVLADGYFMIT